MVGNDLLLGFILARLFGLFGGRDSASRPPSSSAPAPAPAPALPPTAPKFPTNVDVPEPAPPEVLPPPPPGMKRAVEVWRVKPSTREAATVLVGAGAALSMRDLEKNFPKGWEAVPKVTAAEVATAKELLSAWEDGKIIFAGPSTLADRRAFRMTKHPASTPAGTATPAPIAKPSTPSSPTIPASFPSSAPSSPPPFVPPSSPPAEPGLLVTTLRKGEGLAQRAKALGRPENAASAAELQRANLPTGPGGIVYEKTALASGGLKVKGRKGGLQPGDRLFVPASWGPIDPSRL